MATIQVLQIFFVSESTTRRILSKNRSHIPVLSAIEEIEQFESIETRMKTICEEAREKLKQHNIKHNLPRNESTVTLEFGLVTDATK